MLKVLVCITILNVYKIAEYLSIHIGEGLHQLGEFGSSHFDQFDDPGGITSMIANSNTPRNHGYEDGRFHLLALGFWIKLKTLKVVNFSGLRVHGGTPPLSPPGQVPKSHIVRITHVAYPPKSMLSGAGESQIGLAALPDHSLFTLKPEMSSLTYDPL
jgi:hypothetical protein